MRTAVSSIVTRPSRREPTPTKKKKKQENNTQLATAVQRFSVWSDRTGLGPTRTRSKSARSAVLWPATCPSAVRPWSDPASWGPAPAPPTRTRCGCPATTGTTGAWSSRLRCRRRICAAVCGSIRSSSWATVAWESQVSYSSHGLDERKCRVITAHFDWGCEKSINYLNFFYALFWPPYHRHPRNSTNHHSQRPLKTTTKPEQLSPFSSWATVSWTTTTPQLVSKAQGAQGV